MKYSTTKTNIKNLYWGKNNHRLMWAQNDFHTIFTYDGITMFKVDNDPDLTIILESLKAPSSFENLNQILIEYSRNIVLRDLTLDDKEAEWVTSDKITLISFLDQDGNRYIFNKKYIDKKIQASRYRYDIWKIDNAFGMYVREYDQDMEDGPVVKMILGVRR